MEKGRSWLPKQHNRTQVNLGMQLHTISVMKLKKLKEDRSGRLIAAQVFSCFYRTLCWFSIFFSFTLSSEKEGLAVGSSSQQSVIILYLSQNQIAW